MPATREQVRAYRERLRQRAYQAVGASCKLCGDRSAVEFCHIVATGLRGSGRGQYRRWLDVVRNPDCYLPMCRFCHEIYDSSHGQWGGGMSSY